MHWMRHTLGTREQFSNSVPAKIAKAYFCIHCVKGGKAGEGSRFQFAVASIPLKFLHVRTIKVLFCCTLVFLCPLRQCLSSCLSAPLLLSPHPCCTWDSHWKTLNKTKKHIFLFKFLFCKSLFPLHIQARVTMAGSYTNYGSGATLVRIFLLWFLFLHLQDARISSSSI